MIEEKTNITKFKHVLGGEEELYDICVSVDFLDKNRVSVREPYPEYVYLGKGFVTVVDNKPYNGKILCHFWRYK